MPLDHEIKLFLDQLATQNIPALSSLSPAAARAQTSKPNSVPHPAPLASVRDKLIAAGQIQIPVRIYTPLGTGPFPALVYFHGGGFVIGSVAQSSDAACRVLANSAQCVVISVEYRLAPEYPFPAAPEDCYAATCWVAAHTQELNIISDKIGVAGTSAGANLATVICLMARDRNGPHLSFQLLMYPVTDNNFDRPSYRKYANGYHLSLEDMRWFNNHYLPNPQDKEHYYAAPLRAPSLQGLPPALVITAEYDPLCDEGAAYAERLQAEGVKTEYRCYPGLIHGFVSMSEQFSAAKTAWQEICSLAQSYLHT